MEADLTRTPMHAEEDVGGALQEALSHLRATNEVLSLIQEFPHSTAPVFDGIVKRAADLCDAACSNIQLYDGKVLNVSATYGFSHEVDREFRSKYPMVPDETTLGGRAILSKGIAYQPDLFSDQTYSRQKLAREGQWRSLLVVPMMKDGESVGVIAVAHPKVAAFSQAQIRLLETFASQAVIALENARVLRELQDKTDALAELNRTLEERVARQVDQLDRIGRLRRFLPRQLAEAVLDSGDESLLRSHRREVSVVFCDLRGFTSFSEVAEPEEVVTVLGDYHRTAGPLIEEIGGTLERFLGDGLMVLFNDPLPCDDPAGRAVRLAAELRDRMHTLCSEWREQGYQLGFGAGIAHGFATLGHIGFEGRADYTAIGTVVNQAA